MFLSVKLSLSLKSPAASSKYKNNLGFLKFNIISVRDRTPIISGKVVDR